ncbi:MAG: hypothetical protein KAH33_02125 [Candidatus Delongbacteria bacterium]|nr:hypothetical protein [Candidatus Delongbacteria bacterium]
MNKNIVMSLIGFFLVSLSAMSDDGGNEPIADKKEVKQEVTQETKQVENTTQTGKFFYRRDNRGHIVSEKGGILIFADKIVKNSKGNEIVLDWHKRNTGLTVDEYVKHYYEYHDRIDEILEQRGIERDSVRKNIGKWYEYRVNLDKLDELKDNGFNVMPKGEHGVGGRLVSVIIGAEAVIIGEIIEFENINPNISEKTTRLNYKLRIKINETLKESKETENTKVMECMYLVDSSYKLPLNKEVVLLLKNKSSKGLLKMSTWFDIVNGTVTYNNNFKGKIKKEMPLEDFKREAKELVRINDADNFYKRSWKEAE